MELFCCVTLHPLTVHEQETNSQYTLTVHYNSGIKTNFGFISNGKLSISRYFVVIVGKVLIVSTELRRDNLG